MASSRGRLHSDCTTVRTIKYLRFGVSPVTTKNDHAQQALPGRGRRAPPHAARRGRSGRGVMLLRISLRVDTSVCSSCILLSSLFVDVLV